MCGLTLFLAGPMTGATSLADPPVQSLAFMDIPPEQWDTAVFLAALAVNTAPTFVVGGRVTTAFGTASSYVHIVALQPDGKLVVAGSSNTNFAVARYLADGSLDKHFGPAENTLAYTPSTNEPISLCWPSKNCRKLMTVAGLGQKRRLTQWVNWNVSKKRW